MAIRAVIFDLFDTLVDLYTERIPYREVEGRKVPASLDRIVETLGERLGDAAPPLADVARAMGDIDREFRAGPLAESIEVSSNERFGRLLEALGLAADDALRDGIVDAHMDVLQSQVAIPSHHEPVLLSLRQDRRLALCSNFSHAKVARAVLDQGGFTEHLHEIVISEDVRYRKPRPEIFEIVLERLGVEPREALHVGDNLADDVSGAAAAGIHTVWLTRRVRDPEAAMRRHAGPPPDFALEDLLDLPVLLARLG